MNYIEYFILSSGVDGLASPLVMAVKSILERTVADEIDEDGLQ